MFVYQKYLLMMILLLNSQMKINKKNEQLFSDIFVIITCMLFVI